VQATFSAVQPPLLDQAGNGPPCRIIQWIMKSVLMVIK
jgi:hypothetical protein